ncbi:MAG: hypothetical protein DWQ08_09415 [Proteobacteria bacterium]|nr:MAG: hypothetical protein DWQ08_09415 [Pseudomonadota bacterium]
MNRFVVRWRIARAGRRAAVAVMIVAAWGMPSFAADLIVRVVTEEFPPFDYTAEDGSVSGVATEVVRAVLGELDIDVGIEVLPWARALRLARTDPGTLLFSVVRTPEREDQFHWVGVVCEVKSYLFRLSERTEILPGSLSDLKGYSIGVVRDWAGQKYLEQNGFTQLQLVAESDSNIKKLLNGRVDLIEDYEANLIYRLDNLGFDVSLVEKVYFNADISGPLYAVLNKKTDPALVERFRDAFSRVHLDGRYEAIQRGWRLPP